MKSLFIFLIILLVLLFGWRFYQSEKQKGKIESFKELISQKSVSTVQVSSVEKSVVQDDERKNIYKEPFLIVMDKPKHMVMTDEDWYREGEYCKRGKVLKIDERMIYVRGFDTRPIVILQDLRRRKKY